MTNQEIFDTVWTKLKEQGCKSESNASCRYRGPNGIKCAAGYLILDEDYSRNMEGCDAAAPSVISALQRAGVLLNSLGLVLALQRAHDGASAKNFLPELERNMLLIAAQRQLDDRLITGRMEG